MCSYVDIKKIICALNVKTHERQVQTQDNENRLVWSEGNYRQIPRTERSVHVKIAQKINANFRHGRNLAVLNKLTAHGSSCQI